MPGQVLKFDASDAFRVAADLAKIPIKTQARLITITRMQTQLLRTDIIRNASTGHHPPGKPHIPGTGPGPNVATGDYIRSWVPPQISVTPAGVIGETGTNEPQARRLEYGFSGADSLGRVYDQPPYPHVFPALEKRGVLYELACMEAVAW